MANRKGQATPRAERKPKKGEVVRTQSPSYVSAYCNSANINVGFFDFTFLFGEVAGVDKTKNIIQTKDSARIFMSPEHAKAFHDLLGRQLDVYTKKFGPLRKPPE